MLKKFCSLGVDAYALEWIIKEEDTFEMAESIEVPEGHHHKSLQDP